MQICFFEDKPASRFHPLTLTRPMDDLRIGILTIAEKWYHALQPETCSRIPRPELSALFPPSALDETKPCIWINSRCLPSKVLISKIRNLGENSCIQKGKMVVAARTEPSVTTTWIREGQSDFHSLSSIKSQDNGHCISNLWDLFLMNEQEIAADLARISATPKNQGKISPHAVLENREQIFIDKNAVIEPGAVLLAKKGPIFIGEETTIQAGAIIRGPAAICNHSVVKMGAKICKGSTVGPACKVNGEINNSIIHSYSNKAHQGYLGNSLIGQWCNLGADTNTSNLKNNYGNIRITDWQSGKKIETGQQFLGTVMGDHTKTALNTHLNTGTLCGVSCNIFSSDFPPTYIPSFSWVGNGEIQPYKLDKALETMQTMMSRRNIRFANEYVCLMSYLFKTRNKTQ